MGSRIKETIPKTTIAEVIMQSAIGRLTARPMICLERDEGGFDSEFIGWIQGPSPCPPLRWSPSSPRQSSHPRD